MHDLDRIQTEYGASAEEFDLDVGELEQESGGVYRRDEETTFDEAEELELAAELLDVSDERELDQFLGKWINKFGRKATRFLKTGTGQALGGVLKGAIRKVLPGVAATAGNLLVPGLGGVLGPKAASMAGSLLGLELEGLSPEDQEFEAARQVVRLGTAAMENAAGAPEGESARDVAIRALSAAAQRYAPGLLRRAPSNGTKQESGRWYREGNRIVLEGL